MKEYNNLIKEEINKYENNNNNESTQHFKKEINKISGNNNNDNNVKIISETKINRKSKY